MYGMEKQKNEQFMFDLEIEIKNNPQRVKELLTKTDGRVQNIKKILREGTNDKDFEKWGMLLHGYSALQKVLKKAAK